VALEVRRTAVVKEGPKAFQAFPLTTLAAVNTHAEGESVNLSYMQDLGNA
jgi:hypothetical protein